jgi:hypothetical protein
MVESKPNKDLVTHGPITFVPAIHGRLEFGVLVRRIFNRLKPDAVAVELPATLRQVVEKGLDRLPYLSVVLYPEKDGRYVYLPVEPQDALMAAAQLARSQGVPLFFIDRDTEGYPRHREALPDPYAVTRLGLAAYVKAYEDEFGGVESGTEDHLREMTMAFHLQNLTRDYGNVLCVLGLAHYPAVRRLLDQPLALPLGRVRREEISLANLAAESSREILSDMPFLIAALVKAGQENDPAVDLTLDRLTLHRELLNQARDRYFKGYKEEVSQTQMAILFKFARNYSLIQNYLTPDLYQLLVAARGAVDDNFAYEVWDLGSEYPWQEQDSLLPTLRLKGEDLYLDTKKIQFYRRFRHFRRRLVSVPLKKRPKEKRPGEWKEAWDGRHICSFPPEDIVIEGFGDYLKKKTVQILSEENRRVQPFQASMMDGLDMRETIRNWHEGRIYVTENRPVGGRVGSVVVIFDEDQGPEEHYPWCMTWLGEHAQESDMAFYSTPVGENVVGPGISRCEYGGFMLTYPPLRLYDIWKDPFFNGARTKAERLLLAGIDYSEEKLIAYIAARPPVERLRALAGMYGKKVVYLPMGQFAPVTLKKTRVFHVLDSHQVRDWAADYVF